MYRTAGGGHPTYIQTIARQSCWSNDAKRSPQTIIPPENTTQPPTILVFARPGGNRLAVRGGAQGRVHLEMRVVGRERVVRQRDVMRRRLRCDPRAAFLRTADDID